MLAPRFVPGPPPPPSPRHPSPPPPPPPALAAQIRANLPPGADGWGMSLRGLMSMVVVGGFIITAVFYYLNRTVSSAPMLVVQQCLWQYVCRGFDDSKSVDGGAGGLGRGMLKAPNLCRLCSVPNHLSPAPLPLCRCPQVVPRMQPKEKKEKKRKEPMGVAESFTFLAKNPYIRDLAFLVRCRLHECIEHRALQHDTPASAAWPCWRARRRPDVLRCVSLAGQPGLPAPSLPNPPNSNSRLVGACSFTHFIPLLFRICRWWPTASSSTWWRPPNSN